MTIYNKLVRDRIPEIIEQSGKHCKTRVLSFEEYELSLRKKLAEEVEEYLTSNDSNELADIIEVVYALAELHKINPEELEYIRLEKAKIRGGFEQRIFLESVE